MTYTDLAASLGVPLCVGGCGITSAAGDHDAGFVDPFRVIHWRERGFTKRGAKNLLLLIARWTRTGDPEYLNVPEFEWWYLYRDSVMAQRLAGQLGFRIPSALFDPERERCRLLARKRGVKLTTYHSVYNWLNR